MPPLRGHPLALPVSPPAVIEVAESAIDTDEDREETPQSVSSPEIEAEPEPSEKRQRTLVRRVTYDSDEEAERKFHFDEHTGSGVETSPEDVMQIHNKNNSKK